MKTNGNDPITWEHYIRSITSNDGKFIEGSNPGLTKREYFAALAMQGLLSYGNEIESYDINKIPSIAVRHADNLIEELNSNEKE